MKEEEDLTLKSLKLDLIDAVQDIIDCEAKKYVPYLTLFEGNLEALAKLPAIEQQKSIKAIAHKVVSMYHRDNDWRL